MGHDRRTGRGHAGHRVEPDPGSPDSGPDRDRQPGSGHGSGACRWGFQRGHGGAWGMDRGGSRENPSRGRPGRSGGPSGGFWRVFPGSVPFRKTKKTMIRWPGNRTRGGGWRGTPIPPVRPRPDPAGAGPHAVSVASDGFACSMRQRRRFLRPVCRPPFRSGLPLLATERISR